MMFVVDGSPAASPFDNDILTPEPYLHLMVL